MGVRCKPVRKLLFLGQTKMQISSSQDNFDRWKKIGEKDKNVSLKKSKILYLFMNEEIAKHYPAKKTPNPNIIYNRGRIWNCKAGCIVIDISSKYQLAQLCATSLQASARDHCANPPFWRAAHQWDWAHIQRTESNALMSYCGYFLCSWRELLSTKCRKAILWKILYTISCQEPNKIKVLFHSLKITKWNSEFQIK